MAKINLNAIARFITEDLGREKRCALEVIMPGDDATLTQVSEAIEAEGWEWYDTNQAPGGMMAMRFSDAQASSFGWPTKHEEKDGLRRANVALKKLGITALKVRGCL